MSNKYQSFFYFFPGSAFLIVLEGIRIFFLFFFVFCLRVTFFCFIFKTDKRNTNKQNTKTMLLFFTLFFVLAFPLGFLWLFLSDHKK